MDRSSEDGRLKKIAARSNLRLFRSSKDHDPPFDSPSHSHHRYGSDVSSKHEGASTSQSWKPMKGESSRPTKHSSPPSRPKISGPILESFAPVSNIPHGKPPTPSKSYSHTSHAHDIDTRNLGRPGEALRSHPPPQRQDRVDDDRVKGLEGKIIRKEDNSIRKVKERHRHVNIYQKPDSETSPYLTRDSCAELAGEYGIGDCPELTDEYLDQLNAANRTRPKRPTSSDMEVQIGMSSSNTGNDEQTSRYQEDEMRRVAFDYGEMYDQERETVKAQRAQSRKYQQLYREEQQKVKACGEVWPILSSVATYYQIDPRDVKAIESRLVQTMNEEVRLKNLAPVVAKLAAEQDLDPHEIEMLGPAVKKILEGKKAAENEVKRLTREYDDIRREMRELYEERKYRHHRRSGH